MTEHNAERQGALPRVRTDLDDYMDPTIGAFSALARALTSESMQQLNSELVRDCHTIIANDSRPFNIRKVNYLVSSHASTVDLGQYIDPSTGKRTVYYARVAQEIDKKGDHVGLPKIIFDKTEGSNVVTNIDASITFEDGVLDEPILKLVYPASIGDMPEVMIDDELRTIASDIISDIFEHLPEENIDLRTRKDKIKDILQKADVKNKITQLLDDPTPTRHKSWNINGRLTRGELRRRRLGVAAISLVGLYGHMVAGFDSTDIKAGPLPLPVAPIEVLNDLMNMPDHKAQGFEKPEGAAEISVGETTVVVPILGDYDTDGVPDGTYVGVGTNASVRNATELSKKGLYEFDFSLRNTERLDSIDEINAQRLEESAAEGFDYEPIEISDSYSSDETYLTSDACFEITGDFIDSKTSVFTQTPSLENALQIETIDQDTARVCVDEDAAQTDGSIFLYQAYGDDLKN